MGEGATLSIPSLVEDDGVILLELELDQELAAFHDIVEDLVGLVVRENVIKGNLQWTLEWWAPVHSDHLSSTHQVVSVKDYFSMMLELKSVTYFLAVVQLDVRTLVFHDRRVRSAQMLLLERGGHTAKGLEVVRMQTTELLSDCKGVDKRGLATAHSLIEAKRMQELDARR